MTDTSITELLKEAKKSIDILNAQNKQVKISKQIERMERINSEHKFSIDLTYRKSRSYSTTDKFGNTIIEGIKLNQTIQIEGIENAMKIYNQYKNMAFDIKLEKIEIRTPKERIKGINFTYRIDA